jgi:hypothetical protein
MVQTGVECEAGPSRPHHFHIPVMGSGFTIDAALKVARYGIDTCLSLLDDTLCEQLRYYYSQQHGLEYRPIAKSDEDGRARRITAYLDLLHELVQDQVRQLRQSGWGAGSDLHRYYQLLPEGELKSRYNEMLACQDTPRRAELERELAELAVPGRIDVNIMTKCDRDNFQGTEKLPPIYCDAMAALRGYGNSRLESAVEFSAGLNPRLYQYIAQFEDFFPDATGRIRKQIILKVSDFRSALIQGRFLAKKGLFVSEFRIESGLNCGGHAFSSRGQLLACVLTEFALRRKALRDELWQICNQALAEAERPLLPSDLHLRLSVQGGVGTAAEHELLRRKWHMDSVGWGTPFLLVPEATNVDDEHLEKLARARQRDVIFSDISPLGVPFWTLRNSASEENRRRLIREGRPGAVCIKGHARVLTEYPGLPLCAASHAYQSRKIAELQQRRIPRRMRNVLQNAITVKACICHELSGVVCKKLGIDPQATPCITVGPNIIYFRRQASLDEMVGHIYGRVDLLRGVRRPHMLYREMQLNVMALKRQALRTARGLLAAKPQDLINLRNELLEQIAQYRQLIDAGIFRSRTELLRQISNARGALRRLNLDRMVRRTPS